jgi:5'-nucleotidase
VIKAKMEQPIGYTGVDLDARFEMIRTRETNISNLIADVMKVMYDTDIAIINSGSLRIDSVIPEGVLKWKDIEALLPMEEDCVILSLTGAQLKEALENGVSQVPKLEGRFPCVSGLRFKFDTSKPAMNRVTEIEVDGDEINEFKEYTLATKYFLYAGKDGYDVLNESELISDGENQAVLKLTLVNFLHKLALEGDNKIDSLDEDVLNILNVVHNKDKDVATVDDEVNNKKVDFLKI